MGDFRTRPKGNEGSFGLRGVRPRRNGDAEPRSPASHGQWHAAGVEGGFLESRDGANAFRADLELLRRKLVEFSLRLHDMAYGRQQPDSDTPARCRSNGGGPLLCACPFRHRRGCPHQAGEGVQFN